MDAEVGGHGDGAAEVENGVQCIKNDHEEWVTLERLLEGRGNEVEQRQHGEDGDKHVVVDNRWVAGVGGRNHVTDERHDEESPDELLSPVSASVLVLKLGRMDFQPTWKARMPKLTI